MSPLLLRKIRSASPCCACQPGLPPPASEFAPIECPARPSLLNSKNPEAGAIYRATLIKVDFMIRKREDYRLHGFARRVRFTIADFEVWVVGKEDLILSKLHLAKESMSARQFSAVEN